MADFSQCPSGHFFDRDIYPSCPYCNGESHTVDRLPDNIGGYVMPLLTLPDPEDGIPAASGKQGTNLRDKKTFVFGSLLVFFGLAGLVLVALKGSMIPGCALLIASLIGAAFLCQKKRKRRVFENALDSIQKLVFSIGGYFQGYETRTFTVSGEKVALEVNHTLRTEMASPADYYPFTTEKFIAGLKGIHIDEWKKHYYNKHVLDGTQWELTIFCDGNRKPVEISGSNAFPQNFYQLKNFLCNDPYTCVMKALTDIVKRSLAEARNGPPADDQITTFAK